MRDDGPRSTQSIPSGDDRHSYQAARDVNIHNHNRTPPDAQSLIQKAANADIAQYDPKTARVIGVSEAQLLRYDQVEISRARSAGSSRFFSLILLGYVAWTIYKIGAWLFGYG